MRGNGVKALGICVAGIGYACAFRHIHPHRDLAAALYSRYHDFAVAHHRMEVTYRQQCARHKHRQVQCCARHNPRIVHIAAVPPRHTAPFALSSRSHANNPNHRLKRHMKTLTEMRKAVTQGHELHLGRAHSVAKEPRTRYRRHNPLQSDIYAQDLNRQRISRFRLLDIQGTRRRINAAPVKRS